MSNQMPGTGGPGFGPFHGNNFRGGFRGFHHYYPGAYAYAYRPRFRFLPRLFWFAMGAGAYAMWRNHKERQLQYHGANGGGDVRSGEWGCWKGRERERIRAESASANVAAAAIANPVQDQRQGQDGLHSRPGFQRQWSWGSNAWNNNNPSQPQRQQQITDEPRVDVTVDWHTDKVREMGKQATDAMSDVSEAALDHLISSVQALKDKIAENRAQREQNEPLPLEQRIPVEQQQRNGYKDGREPRRYV